MKDMLMNSRAQVKEALLQQEIKILLTLPETTPFIHFFFENIPNLKIINLTRDGLEVAKGIADKNWFSHEQLLSPKNSQPYRLVNYQSKDYYLPWWVTQEEAQAFISISNIERALWYWHYFHSSAIQQEKKLSAVHQQNLLHLDSVELFKASSLSSNKLQSFLKIRPMALTSHFTLSSPQSTIDIIPWSKSMPCSKRNEIEKLLKSQQKVESTC